MRIKFVFLVAVLAVAIGGSMGMGADAEPNAEAGSEELKLFNELFAPRIEAARRTPDRSDDIEIAKELIALAPDAAQQPKLIKLILLAAFDLASTTPAGYPTAIEALRILERQVPEEKAEVLGNRIKLRQKIYRLSKRDDREGAADLLIDDLQSLGDVNAQKGAFADAVLNYRSAHAVAASIKSTRLVQIKAKISQLSVKRKIGDRAELLKKRFSINKDASTARDLVLIYLIELNQPVEALKYSEHLTDPALQKAVDLSMRDESKLGADDAMALGDFYHELAKKPTTGHRAHAYRRALFYYQRYRALQPDAPQLKTFKIKIIIGKIEKWLTAHGEPLADEVASAGAGGRAADHIILPVGRWVDLSPYVLTLAKDLDIPLPVTTSVRQGSTIRLSSQKLWRATHFYLAAKPTGSYRFQIAMAGGAANFSCYFRLPIGDQRHIQLQVRPGGVSIIKKGSSVQTAFAASLQAGKSYIVQWDVALKGDDVSIQGLINNNPVFQWTGPIDSLRYSYDWGLLNVSTSNSNVPMLFSKPRLFVVNGNAHAFNQGAAIRSDEKNVPAINQSIRHYVTASKPWLLIGRVEGGKTYQLNSSFSPGYGWRTHSDRTKTGHGAVGDSKGRYYLQGKIGINGTPFKIADARSFIAATSGALYLGMSDEPLAERYDNFGSIKLQIKLEGAPRLSQSNQPTEPTDIWFNRSYNISGNVPWTKAGLVKGGRMYQLRGYQPSDGGIKVPGIGSFLGPGGSNGKYVFMGRLNGGTPFKIATYDGRSQTRFVEFEEDGLLELGISQAGPNISGKIFANVVRWGFVQELTSMRTREVGSHNTEKQRAGVE